MKLEDLKQLMSNKISTLELRLSSAYQVGDIELCSQIELELVDTKEVLKKLTD